MRVRNSAALEVFLIEDGRRAPDEHLPVHRLGGLHHLRQRRIVGRHRAPAKQLQALLFDDALPHALAVGAQALVARHEDVADGIAAGRRQREAELLALVLEEVVRDLNEHAGAVAGQRVGAHGAAVLEVGENLERVGDDLMRLAALEVGDEADAARIALVRRVVKTLRPAAPRSLRTLRLRSCLGSSSYCDLGAGRCSAQFCSNRTDRRSHVEPD